MEIGGQAADQMARTGIQLTEEAIKLLAAESKNLTAFLLALAKDNKRLSGRTNMGRLLREGKPLKVFRIKEADLEKFRQLAKQYGILFAGVKDTRAVDGMIDLISNVDYVSQLNRVMEVMGYPVPTKEEEAPKKSTARAPQEKCSKERGSGSTPTLTTPTSEKPSVKGRLAALQAANKSMKPSPQKEHTKIR